MIKEIEKTAKELSSLLGMDEKTKELAGSLDFKLRLLADSLRAEINFYRNLQTDDVQYSEEQRKVLGYVISRLEGLLGFKE